MSPTGLGIDTLVQHFDVDALINAAHRAWGAADIDTLLNFFTDDIEYQINAGTEDGSPVTTFGKNQFGDLWRPIVSDIDTRTIPGKVHLSGDVARLQVMVWLQHRKTGFRFSGSYRQILTFRSGLICRIEEYHDAPKLNAFWAVVATENARVGDD